MSSNPQAPKSDPSMRPTSISVLIVAGLAAAALGWLLLSFSYSSLPELPWSPVIVLVVLAVAEGLLAQNTSARIQRKPGTMPVDPLAVARYVALAKASSLVGAISAGFSAGLLAWLAMEPTQAAHDDLPKAAGGVVAALALVGAALWLERACRVPERPDSKDEEDSGLR
ncbi:membrane protein [Paractinoplanes deccanensis]|uniref:Membrane protein n=2 Tax=Paractinoplanes deccanensis TaxID=113561 RepID=A0ABQ3Y5C9_9ACTN|nr:membrane protein [Actinoplanes deccanensis]